jgi:hypothetical protein
MSQRAFYAWLIDFLTSFPLNWQLHNGVGTLWIFLLSASPIMVTGPKQWSTKATLWSPVVTGSQATSAITI